MDKVRVGLVLLILITFFSMAACCLTQSYAAAPDQSTSQTVKQPISQPDNQAPAATVSQASDKPADLPAEKCQEQDSTFWPWKVLMKLDAWVKRNLW